MSGVLPGFAFAFVRNCVGFGSRVSGGFVFLLLQFVFWIWGFCFLAGLGWAAAGLGWAFFAHV